MTVDPHEIVDSEYGFTRLHVAARDGDLALLQALLIAGGDPNIEDTSGNGYRRNKTPLHWALNEKTVALLVEYGADINYLGPTGQPPIGSLAVRNRYSAIKKLVELGAEIDTPDEIGATPLLWCMTGYALGLPDDKMHEDRELRSKLVRFFLERGANVNQQNTFGSTPLGGAVKFAPELIPMLLEFGADPTIPDGDKSVLEWAIEWDNPTVIQQIRTALESQNSK